MVYGAICWIQTLLKGQTAAVWIYTPTHDGIPLNEHKETWFEMMNLIVQLQVNCMEYIQTTSMTWVEPVYGSEPAACLQKSTPVTPEKYFLLWLI